LFPLFQAKDKMKSKNKMRNNKPQSKVDKKAVITENEKNLQKTTAMCSTLKSTNQMRKPKQVLTKLK
jgi:hypothetical protein